MSNWWPYNEEGTCDVCGAGAVLAVARRFVGSGTAIKAFRCLAHAPGLFNVAYVNEDGSWVILWDHRVVNPVYAADLELEFDA